MKKRLIAILLCSTLLFGMTACGGSKSGSDDKNKDAEVSATPEPGKDDQTSNDNSTEGNKTTGDGTSSNNNDTDPDTTGNTDTNKDGNKNGGSSDADNKDKTPSATDSQDNISNDSRSLEDLEAFLKNKGVLAGSREEVDPSGLGAVAGVRYPSSNVEIYEFEPNSENFNILNMGEGILVSGNKAYTYADATHDNFVLIALNDADTEDIANAFSLF